MQEFLLPYGAGHQQLLIDPARVVPVSEPIATLELRREADIIEDALAYPVGCTPLREMCRGKNNIVLIASDHTRPVPSKRILPPMLREIRAGNPQAQITILVATGCHRETTQDELIQKFGEEIVRHEKIVIHDCDDESMLCEIGILPSGGRLRINRLAAQADLLLSEGFIEPHFFAGFSGGRKSVLPGICARETVLFNHCAAFIDDPCARTGVLENNPVHRDMVFAAQAAQLAFIVNVVLDVHKRVIYACAGDPLAAHAQGCAFLRGRCEVSAPQADIVITTNGGYPLDQNIYQSVKSMTAAEEIVRPGGVIIALAKSNDGHGGQAFFEQMSQPDLDAVLAQFRARPAEQTQPDQWQSQIFIRVLKKARVVFVSDAPEEMVRAMHMIPAKTAQQALAIADQLLSPTASAAILPDGVSVIARKA